MAKTQRAVKPRRSEKQDNGFDALRERRQEAREGGGGSPANGAANPFTAAHHFISPISA